jgi:hypothetical protein
LQERLLLLTCWLSQVERAVVEVLVNMDAVAVGVQVAIAPQQQLLLR